MKRNKIYAFIVLQTIFLILSCSEEFLDRRPLDRLVTGNYYKTSEGIQAAANAMYSPLGEEGFNGKTYWMIGDGASDDAQPNGNDPDYLPIDQFTLASDNERNAALWQTIYKMITLTNIVLENVVDNSAEQDLLDRVTGEALMLRAYGYFILVQLYSDVPLIMEGMTAEELLAPSRTSAYEIYLRIVEDLERATELLPAKSEYVGDDIGRVNKHAAMGMLAKVYMTIAGDLSMYNTENNPDNDTRIRSIADPQIGFELALDLCDEIINSGEYQLLEDFRTVFNYPDGQNCAESIWQLQFIGCGSRHGSGNMRQAFWAPWDSQITGRADGWGTHSPHSDLARCFYDNPDDLIIEGNAVDTINVVPPDDLRFRETLMFPGVEYPELPVGAEGTPYALPYQYGASGFACKKYVIGTAGGCNQSMKDPNNVYILRLADIHLLKAECLVELNRSAEAAPVLDGIRTRAGKPLISPSLSQSEMRDIVRLERRRELALEQQRWFDILRWGIAIDVLATQDIILETERRLFPIPSTEIALNENLVQNTGY